MAVETRNRLLDQIDRLFHRGVLGASTDQQLLQRFLADRDEEAFEAIVIRHGPMVLGVCRRYLRDPRDIEDAFQATFLILVRKARSLRNHQLLANWLYGVAYRVAVRARKVAMRTKTFEKSVANMESPAPEEAVADEIGPELDQELSRLPARYRSALVLCYLQGMTQEKAAEKLRCPLGTLRSRLARGRELLKRRLIARGYTASASLIGATLRAPMPTIPVIRAVVASAVQALSSSRIATLTGVSVAETLAEGVLSSMAATSLKRIALAATAIALTTGGITAYAYWPAQNIEGKQNKPAVEPTRKPDDEVVLKPPHKVKPGEFIFVEVLEALPGRPITGSRFVRSDGTITLGYYGDLQVAGLDRYEIKVKLINHLRKYLTDEVLGLIELDEDTGGPLLKKDQDRQTSIVRVKPVDSDRVIVDETVGSYDPSDPLEGVQKQLKMLDEKLDHLALVVSKTIAVTPPANLDGIRNQQETGTGATLLDWSKQFDIREGVRVKLEARQRWKFREERLSVAKATFETIKQKFDSNKATQQELDEANRRFGIWCTELSRWVKETQSEHLDAKNRLDNFKYEDAETDHLIQEFRKRLEETYQRREEGKVTQEDVLDAEANLSLIEQLHELNRSRAKEEVLEKYVEAQGDLNEVMTLKLRYLDPDKNE